MNFCVLGLGTSVPPHTMSQAEALELAKAILKPDPAKARVLEAVYRRAGVKSRHTCIPYQTALKWTRPASPLAVEVTVIPRGATTGARMQLYAEHAPQQALAASHAALANAGCAPAEITHLVTVSCTGFSAPGVDAALIRELGLNPQTERVHVGFMGCHGAMNGLRVASALAALNDQHRVLMCAVELCSLHYFFDWIPDKLVSNALFADGAAALVGGNNVRQTTRWQVAATASFMLPDSVESMSWELGDYGFEMSLSATVPGRIAESLRPWVSQWLKSQGLTLADVAHWVIHPGGPRIVGAVAESLGLPPAATDASREILSKYGNMSSPTVLFIADRLARSNAMGPGVMMAFGPGLVAEVTLVNFS